MTGVETNAIRIEHHGGDVRADIQHQETAREIRHERWAHCHVNWTAVWLGALASFCMVALFGLAGIALGAHRLGPEHRLADLRNLGTWSVIFSVCAAFFSAVIGGWAAVKIAGILHAEPAMLHGAFVWLLTVPLLVLASVLGASSYLGGWYGILGPTTTANAPYAHPASISASAGASEIDAYGSSLAEYNRKTAQWNEDNTKVIRNSALVGLTALLLGLVGCVLGGWMGSGEPMNFTHYQTRKPRYHLT